MGELILALLPVALGVVLSPLAIMALVAILLSRLARVNGVAYLVGWIIGLWGLLALFVWIFQALDVRALAEPPVWVAFVRLFIGLILVTAAVWVYRKGRAHITAMAAASSPQDVVAAAPQLPGWLQTVSSFRPVRSLFLGLGLFVLNPVDASCAILAALEVALADLGVAPTTAVLVGFAIVGTLPIAVPVIVVVVRGANAQPMLDTVRTWIAGNTHVLNAALLLVIGALQLEKAIAALL